MTATLPIKDNFLGKPIHGLTYLENERIVIDRWSKEAQFADVELSHKVEEVTDTKPAKPYLKWLVDLSEVQEDAQSSDAWLYSDLIPFFLNEGYYHIAIVKPRYDYRNTDLEVDIIEIGDRYIGQFENFERAFNWLSSQER